jgi:hypothetical protein
LLALVVSDLVSLFEDDDEDDEDDEVSAPDPERLSVR